MSDTTSKDSPKAYGHFKVKRFYDPDVEQLANHGPITSRVLARHILQPFVTEFGSVVGLSFERSHVVDDDSYTVGVKIEIADFQQFGVPLEEMSSGQLTSAHDSVLAFEDRVFNVCPDDTILGSYFDCFDEYFEIETETHTYNWEVLRKYVERRDPIGVLVAEYSPEDVVNFTALQVGDYAAVEEVEDGSDKYGEGYTVCMIDEDGMADPIRDHLSYEDARTLVRKLSQGKEMSFDFT